MTIEERVIEQRVPVGLGLALQQYVDGVIAFAIERRKEENERTQDNATQHKFGVLVLFQLGENVLTGRHHADKIQTYESAEQPQQDAGGYSLDAPCTV